MLDATTILGAAVVVLAVLLYREIAARFRRDDRHVRELLIALRYLAWEKPRAPDRFAALFLDGDWSQLISTYPGYGAFRAEHAERIDRREEEMPRR
jgi:hypothetical protein